MSRKLGRRLPWLGMVTVFVVGCGSHFQSIFPGPEEETADSAACCGNTIAAYARAPLLENPGFESGLTGWESWGPSDLTASSNSGNQALRLNSGGGRGQEVSYRLKTGATYELKVQARSTDTTGTVRFGIKYFDAGNGSLGENSTVVNTGSYSEKTVRFQMPPSVSSAKVFATHDGIAGSVADFDDFSLVMVQSPVYPPPLPPISAFLKSQPNGPDGDWTLVFDESFADDGLDLATWNRGLWYDYPTSNELQAYAPASVTVAGGLLSLTAERKSSTTSSGDLMAYSSGAITTRDKFTFTFGAIEARMKLPSGRGLHSTFWLLPAGRRAPPIMTVADAFGHEPTVVSSNYTWPDDFGLSHALSVRTAHSENLSAGFHTYTLLWQPEEVSFYLDGSRVGTYRGDFVLRDPAFLILNLAVGGDKAGSPDAGVNFPQNLWVDYVRIWQHPL